MKLVTKRVWERGSQLTREEQLPASCLATSCIQVLPLIDFSFVPLFLAYLRFVYLGKLNLSYRPRARFSFYQSPLPPAFCSARAVVTRCASVVAGVECAARSSVPRGHYSDSTHSKLNVIRSPNRLQCAQVPFTAARDETMDRERRKGASRTSISV